MRKPIEPTRKSNAAAEVEALGAQIVELLERVRLSEERSAYAEQQLVHMTHMANAAAAAAQEAQSSVVVAPRLAEIDFVATKPASRSWLPWTLVGVLACLAGAGFALGYSPLRAQYDAALKLNEEQTGHHVLELSKLRAEFDVERGRLAQELASVKAAAAAAAAPPVAEAPAAGTIPASRAEPRSHEHSSEASEARAAKAEERKAERAAKSEERKAERAAKAEERKAAREAKRAEGGSSKSDDDDGPSSSKKPAKAESKPASAASGGDDPLEGLGDDSL
jgi:hypothetical protein